MRSILLLTALLGLYNHGISAAPTLDKRAGVFASTKLKILPLGDSITWGTGSPDKTSYRKFLYDKLVAEGASIQMVGSQSSGAMSQPKHEGHRGATIEQISGYADAEQALPTQPNVILVHAGTNDMRNDREPKTAYKRLFTMVNKILDKDKIATVFVAKIILDRSETDTRAALTRTFNEEIQNGLFTATDKSKRVVLVDFSKALDNKTDYNDNLHPDASGYKKMADIWYKALADNKKLIKPPKTFDDPTSASS